MYLVDRPTLVPGQCFINNSAEDPGGFIDVGDRVAVDPRVYISRQAVIDMGRMFGLPTPEEFQQLSEDYERLSIHTAALEEENTSLNRDVEAAEWTLERKFQTKPQAKPGRKPKVTT